MHRHHPTPVRTHHTDFIHRGANGEVEWRQREGLRSGGAGGQLNLMASAWGKGETRGSGEGGGVMSFAADLLHLSNHVVQQSCILKHAVLVLQFRPSSYTT